MSASSGEPYGNPRSNNGPLSRGPLEDAPEGGGRQQSDKNATDAAPEVKTGLTPDQIAPPPAPWKRTKRREMLAVDVAVAPLRTQLPMPMAPDRHAEPSSPDSPAAALVGAWRAIGVAVVMIGIAGYLWSDARWTTPPRRTAAVSDRVDVGRQPLSAPNHEPPFGSQTMKMGSSMSVPVPAAADDRAATPRIATTDQPVRQATAAEIAMMMKQGELFMANGDISGARLVFQRAAEARDGAAALALAETYDPLVLGKSSTKAGIISDVAVARRWYERASELGSTAARERIARLAGFGE
jgi:hypothetical protein